MIFAANLFVISYKIGAELERNLGRSEALVIKAYFGVSKAYFERLKPNIYCWLPYSRDNGIIKIYIHLKSCCSTSSHSGLPVPAVAVPLSYC